MVGDWLVTEKLKQSIESGEIKLGSDEYNKLLNTIKITAGAILDIYLMMIFKKPVALYMLAAYWVL